MFLARINCVLCFSTDIMPENITQAVDRIPHVNLMPAYGLNVYSMLKYDTLVLTTAAVDHIERKLLEILNVNNAREVESKFKLNQV